MLSVKIRSDGIVVELNTDETGLIAIVETLLSAAHNIAMHTEPNTATIEAHQIPLPLVIKASLVGHAEPPEIKKTLTS